MYFNLSSVINLRFSSSIIPFIHCKCSFCSLRLPDCCSLFWGRHFYALCISSRHTLMPSFSLCSSLSHLHLPFCQSVYLFWPFGGRGSFEALHLFFLHCQSSTKANRIYFEQDSALDWILYVISFLCLCGSIPSGAC